MKQIQRALRSLDLGGSKLQAIAFLKECGYEVRENRHMQETACDGTQFHTVTIGLYDCSQEYGPFQYEYMPSNRELRALLRALCNQTTDCLIEVDPIIV
jgi:hypothetical protein